MTKEYNAPTTEDICQRRNPSQFRDWCKSVLDGVPHEKRSDVRFRIGIWNAFCGEVLPLSYLANHLEQLGIELEVTPVIGDQNYDSVIELYLPEGKCEYKLEITEARQGQEEYLRMRYLQEHGHVWPFGEITKTGTERTGIKISVSSDCVERTETQRKALKLIKNAILKKLNKNYERNSHLLVMVEDIGCFRDEHAEEDYELLTAMMIDAIEPNNEIFRVIYILGWSKESFIAFTFDEKTSEILSSDTYRIIPLR